MPHRVLVFSFGAGVELDILWDRYIALTACISSNINETVINLWQVTSNQAWDCVPIYIFLSLSLSFSAMPSDFQFLSRFL